jgi:alcohol dehydrogenase (cytochrome c)
MFLRTLKHFTSPGIVGFLLLAGAACLPAQNPPGMNSIPYVGASWPTFNGDTSGRRFSTLSQINRTNVHSLKLAWAFQTHTATLKSTPLEIGGILYFTVPNRVWAIDAKTGEKIWAFRRNFPGDHLGQRGVAFYQNRIYFGTTNAHLFCLDARNGKVIWDVTVADVKFGYYISVAPLIVKGLVVLGASGDSSNVPHYIEALDWKTGNVVWKTSVLPKPGTPAARTWPNDQAMRNGGGAAWMTGTYDPALNLIYWGTGNPHPVDDGLGRPGANLYTCTILALNPETGAIVWYFQASPHDTHDWDAVQTPVLFNAKFKGKPRELLAQASRNGYFFLLDRTTGKNLLTVPYVPANWAQGIDADGSPIPNPAKEPQPAGTLVRLPGDGATVWMSPSFDPETGLFYVNAMEGYTYWYLALNKQGQPKDHQGGGNLELTLKSVLLAVDYKTGKIRWRRPAGNRPLNAGILTTAGHVLFTADAFGNLLALDPSDGHVLWHTRPGGNVDDAAPMTYQLDGTQYVVTGVDGVLYAWSLTGSL